MSRIAETFARCKAENRTALMPFLTVGYPDLATSEQILLAMAEAGADLIEVGVPFSDPIAEGKTVQHTSQVSLENGTRMTDCIALVKRARKQGVTVPLMLMGYFNPVVKYGVERYVADCADAGVDGFIIPDLPIEESERIRSAAAEHDLDLTFMVAPTTTDDRLQQVGKLGSGFVYCVAVTGVTGARDNLTVTLDDYLAKVRSFIDLPLAIGFGITTPEHVDHVGEVADGAIVGSALLNYLATRPDDMPSAAADYVRYLRGENELP